MKILSFDTAMAACSAAVVETEDPVPLAAAFVPMERGHAEALAPLVADVLARSGTALPAIARIAVTTGPGTFTGVRIGLAFARGLGLARGIPVVGIDSLSAIAANDTAGFPLLAASDARNGDIYAASFDADGMPLSAPRVTTAAGAAAGLLAGTRLIGTAARAVLEASGRTDLALSTAGDLPVAAHFARLAAGAAPSGMPEPLYLRAPDAKPQSAPLRRITGLEMTEAGLAAAPVLSALHGEAFEEGWSAAEFEGLLRMPGAQALLAAKHGEPLGFLLTRTAADEAEIITICTRPSAQRRGVARLLLSRQAERLRVDGVQRLFLEVAASNLVARGLYESLGFTEAGRRKGYYRRRDGFEDAIVMRRETGV